MSDAPQAAKGGALRWMLGGLGGGAGVTLALAMIDMVKSRPEFFPQLLNSGLLGFTALMGGMVLFGRKFDAFNEVQLRQVAAQERLAANVGALVEKDDSRAREQELTLNHLARQSDAILQELQRIKAEPIP